MTIEMQQGHSLPWCQQERYIVKINAHRSSKIWDHFEKNTVVSQMHNNRTKLFFMATGK